MLDDGFHFLDQLPDGLYRTVVTTRHGRLSERVDGILRWRRALLAGTLPRAADLAWPVLAISEPILRRLETLELAALCAGEEALTDHVLGYLCAAVDSFERHRELGIEDQFDDALARNRHQGRSGTGRGEQAGGGVAPLSPRERGWG